MWLVSLALWLGPSGLPKPAEPSGCFHQAPALPSDVAKLQAASGSSQYRPTTASFCQLPQREPPWSMESGPVGSYSVHDPTGETG